MSIVLALLAVLSVWDYPSRQPAHERLRAQFFLAMRRADFAAMEEACRKGTALLPDDPVWQYNLACALAHSPQRADEALDALEKSVDLGFRDAAAIGKDRDFALLSKLPRFADIVEQARTLSTRPILTGPLAVVPATGVFGQRLALGEQNLGWDFDTGCFVAHMRLTSSSAGGNTGDLYVNRDGHHSALNVADFPGLTEVTFDAAGRARRLDLDLPNILYPYPVFGNASRAFVSGPSWRSLTRAMLTADVGRLKLMQKAYLSNHLWVFPANADTPPVGRLGDLFSSVVPYWLTTAGRSWSDQPYLRAALEASRSLQPPVKAELVKDGLLAPTIMTLLRKSLRGVDTEADYLTAKAHPTAMPPGGIDPSRVARKALQLTSAQLPPLTPVSVTAPPPKRAPPQPELTYATPFAWALVLRADEPVRTFFIRARGAEHYAFVQTHGENVKVDIRRLEPDAAQVTIDRRGMSPTNRVDVMVCGRRGISGWGAPSYVSFAVVDPSAPYSDPVLTPGAAAGAK